MATWAYNAAKIYITGDGPEGALINIPGTLTDGDPTDDFFDTTETITGGNDGDGATDDDGTFVGTVELLGVTWVAIETNAGYTVFYATVPPGTKTNDINQAFNTIDGSPSDVGNIALSNTSGFTTCFAAGTLIATPKGETLVETLEIGDLVTTADGRAVPVKWTGRQTLHKLFTPVERFMPVRVTAGALGNGLPHTDLVLTADHALILDGLAVNAGALINGTTISCDRLDTLPDRVTYYHIETEEHDVILANGAPAETFVDYVGRRAFDNYAEYVALYGDEPVIAEMPLHRVSSRRQLPADLRARFGIGDFAKDVTQDAMTYLESRKSA